VFFFKKKNQKTFDCLGCVLTGACTGAQKSKVFWFFFSKKNNFQF